MPQNWILFLSGNTSRPDAVSAQEIVNQHSFPAGQLDILQEDITVGCGNGQACGAYRADRAGRPVNLFQTGFGQEYFQGLSIQKCVGSRCGAQSADEIDNIR